MTTEWGKVSAGEICRSIAGSWISGDVETIVKGICTDSRKIISGELFLALTGERYNGHDFVGKALKKGAVGCIIQRGLSEDKIETDEIPKSILQIPRTVSPDPVIISVDDTLKALGDLAEWWRQEHRVKLTAITGSSGKTTTKEMLAGILELGSRTLKNEGNLNNLIGLPLTLLLLDGKFKNCVVEMGMNRRGEIARLTEIAQPDVGVITNVGMVHLEGLGDIKKVAKAKLELLEKMPERCEIILNGDDELLMKEAAAFHKEKITFGFRKKNDVRAKKIRNLGREGISFDLEYRNVSWPVRLKVPGLHNVLNALAATAAGLRLHEPPERIVQGLGRFEGVKGRFAVNCLPGGAIIVDDTYNSNPSSLEAVLASIENLVSKGGRIIAGLGEMMELGRATDSAHRKAGRMVAELGAHYLFAMGEHAGEMIRGAVDSGMSSDQVEVVTTHSEMARKIKGEMRKGDLVFLKGSRKIALEKVVEDLQSTQKMPKIH